MYLFEWLFEFAKSRMTYEEAVKIEPKRRRASQLPAAVPPENVKESVSEKTYDNSSIYAHNDTYIDVRTPNDEKRGLITLAALIPLASMLYASHGTLVYGVIRYFIQDPATRTLEHLIFGVILTPATLICGFYLYFKYLFRLVLLESFTARRLIVRFNRVTRKVYLLRPKRIGGTKILDWDKTEIVVDKTMTEMEGVGGFVVLLWDRGCGVDLRGQPTDNVEMALVGKKTRNASELLAFWEYIRRFMEDGPSAAPRPAKLICKTPWPWLSVRAAWGLDTSFLRHSGLWIFIVIQAILLPVVLIHAIGHWISLLLCYEPRFPKAIEEAGKLTITDAMPPPAKQSR